ncbi:MAG TPA: hypothetical protein VGQ68_05360 [Gaiellaceae bacterium]|nr:hypothetical protein [Gaiellaceae bacterium]
MTDKVKNALLVAASITALALGGAAVAGAASGGGSSSSGSAATSRAPASGLPPQRSDEQRLTGDTESKVRAAALAKVAGGTIQRVETDADGHAAYEAHMVKADGTRVTVYVDKSFDVVSVESGP